MCFKRRERRKEQDMSYYLGLILICLLVIFPPKTHTCPCTCVANQGDILHVSN